MARQRKNKADNWMPPGVRLDKKGNRYIIRSKLSNGKELRLCGPKATRSQVWMAYEALTDHPDQTLNTLCAEYLKSQKYKKLAHSTQDLYGYCFSSLKKITFNEGNKFIELTPQRVTSGILTQILDLRESQGNAVMGNREIKGFLSAVFTWAIQRDQVKGLTVNPCHLVTRNKEESDKRYVTDAHYYFALSVAREEDFPEFLHRSMELCYLLYNRITETLKLMRTDLLENGVDIHRLKGSKDNIVKWSPRLKEAVKSEHKVTSMHVLHDEKGQQISYAKLRYQWDRLMNRCEEIAEKENINFMRFHRHHLKAKGCSDQEKEQNSAGHISPEIREQYNRKKDEVEPAR